MTAKGLRQQRPTLMIPAEKVASSAEWRILLACGAPVPDRPLLQERLRSPFSSEDLFALAELHGLVPLLAHRLGELEGDFLSAGFRQRLHEQRRAQLLFTLSLTAEMFRLLEDFRTAGIDAVVVKGPTLALQAFGDPAVRQYSDLDILVRHRDVLRAATLMSAAGFSPEIPLDAAAAGRVPGQFLFMRPATHTVVELHTERTLRYFPRPLPLETLFSRRVCVSLDGREVATLSPEDTLSFICVHGSKHLWERLMWIADVAALVTRPRVYDWSRAMATAREMGAVRMVHLGLRLATDCLQAAVPEQIGRAVRADRAAARLAERVLQQLPAGENAERGVIGRALFRAQTCGGLIRGPLYLLRLSLAPTEEDWNRGGQGSRWLEVMRRPFRLAQKYRGERKGTTRPSPEQSR